MIRIPNIFRLRREHAHRKCKELGKRLYPREARAIARLGAAFPRLGSSALPLLAAQGRRVQKKMVENGPTLR